MATTVHTITISVADLEDGTYAIALSAPQTNQVDQFDHEPQHVYTATHLTNGYLNDLVLGALGIDEEA